MRGEGTDTRLRADISIENRCRAMKYGDGFGFIRSKAESEMLEIAREGGVDRGRGVQVRRSVSRWNIRKGTLGEMDS